MYELVCDCVCAGVSGRIRISEEFEICIIAAELELRTSMKVCSRENPSFVKL